MTHFSNRAAHARSAGTGEAGRRRLDAEIEVDAGGARLRGRLTIPEPALGVVIFVHGSGSSRHSPRNRYVASILVEHGLGTLLFDLLTPEEERERANVFDIARLARRLQVVSRWLATVPEARGLPVGWFGALAAADPAAHVAAIVSRGGRPDLAGERLAEVRTPTLLVVGDRDDVVLGFNREAQARLRCESRLEIVPGATHLFEEPGTLRRAAELACDWFVLHLGRRAGARAASLPGA
jgi:putative phosphoribosyl transferase